MTYSQPQQQQSNYRPNRAALWVNQYKNTSNQPDYRGNVEISYALFQELSAAFSSGQYEADRGGQPCIKLDLALYVQQGGDRAPVMSGMISTLSEMQQRAAARAARQQQQQPPQQQYGQPPAPQPPAPMPQQQQAPQPPVPNWLAHIPVPPEFAQQQPAAPAPMPQQQPPQPPVPNWLPPEFAQQQQQPAPQREPVTPAPMPQQQAYQQPPQPQAPAPLAPPPAGVQPMPGAIHAPQPPIMPPAVAAL